MHHYRVKKSSNFEWSEVSSLPLKMYKLTNQVEDVIALACSVESEDFCEAEVVGLFILISNLGSAERLL